MRKRKNIVFGGIILIIFSIILIKISQKRLKKEKAARVVSTQIAARPNPHVASLLTDYESFIRDELKKTSAPGVAIAIIKDSTIVYLKGFGVREVGTKDSIDINTVFRLASVSKCFAPVLTGLLVDDNVLHWDDKVVHHVPDFSLKKPEQTQDLTLRHVLSHTTGLPYHTYTNLVEDGLDLKTMLAQLRTVNLIGNPGKVYSYQNVGYSIIAQVIENATGKTYEQLMAERIFSPLGMSNASMSYDALMSNTNIAKPHLYRRTGWAVTKIYNTYYNVGPAGGVNASISDMAQWLKALISNQNFIAPTTLEEIFTPTIKAIAKNRNFRKWLSPADSYYALGWRVLNFDDDTLLYHGGYVNGYRSEIAINQKDNIGICVLSNAPGKLVDNSVPYFFKLYFSQRDSINDWDNNQGIFAADTIINR